MQDWNPSNHIDSKETEETDQVDQERDAAEALISLRNSVYKMGRQSTEVQATPETRDFGCQVSSGDIKIPFSNFIRSPKTLNIFTGINSFMKLSCIVNIFSLIQPESSRFSFVNKDKIIMTMMKLKLNWSFAVISILFGCSVTTCKSIILSTATILGSFMQSSITWPSKEEIAQNLPKAFEKFKSVRIILDCTEIRIPHYNCLKCRILSYSHYKGTNTIKYLIGITPGGLISFVSAGYGGRASDKKIFEESNLLEMLEPLDSVMVDKGFLIKSACKDKGVNVIQPPFLRKNQLSKEEATLSLEIARARVHVERVIQRIKKFKVLSEYVPISLLPVIDSVMLIVCGITNLSSPILGDDKFL